MMKLPVVSLDLLAAERNGFRFDLYLDGLGHFLLEESVSTIGLCF